MNTTKQTIGWCDYTWNPITGCKAGCFYCYARKLFNRFSKSFEPEFHPERLNEIDKLKKPCKVFVCSVSDLFSEWINWQWRESIFDKIWMGYEHITFQLLTKEPQNINIYFERLCNIFKSYKEYPENFWIGCTVTDKSELWKIEEIKKVKCGIRFISFEPLLSDMPDLDLKGIDWVIIGKLTGTKAPFDIKWVDKIMGQCHREKIPFFIKNNLKGYCESPIIQEFPIMAASWEHKSQAEIFKDLENFGK